MRSRSVERPAARESASVLCTGDSRNWVSPAWMRSCIFGSVLALGMSGLLSYLIRMYLAPYRSGIYNIVRVELIVAAAILEGAIIGYFQWRVLRRLFPTMSSSAWVGTTMIAAGLGLVISWLPTTFASTAALASRIGEVTQTPAAIARASLVTGALAGLVWGVAQSAVLRLHVHRAGAWIMACTISWTISFGCLFVAALLPDRTTSPVIQIALGPLSGLVLGSALGILHGRVLVRLHSRLLVPVLSNAARGAAAGR